MTPTAWARLRRNGKVMIVGTACVLFGFAAGLLAQTKAMIVVPFEAARFVPADPMRPEGTQIAVLWGDPTTGPSTMLMKFKKGGSPPHVHSSDYHLMLVTGTARHLAEGAKESDAQVLGPGSYWFQPGNQAHSDRCLTDECLMFIAWAGKRDGWLATSKP